MSQEGFIGEVKVFAGNFAPRSWAFCEGQLLPIAQHSALFSILGTIYGGDGRTTFGLPDLRGRTPISAGNGPGLSSYREGQHVGAEFVTLSTAEIPSHNHSASAVVNANDSDGVATTPSGNAWSGSSEGDNIYNSSDSGTTMASDAVQVTVNPNGGSQSHENRPPRLAMRWIICLEGTFPSRD